MVKTYAQWLLIFTSFVFPCLSHDDEESSYLLHDSIAPFTQYMSMGTEPYSDPDTKDNKGQASPTPFPFQSSEKTSTHVPPQFQIFERFLHQKDLPVSKQSENAKEKS